MAYGDRGQANLLSRKYDQAISDYSEAISRNPKWPDFYFRRAEVYRRKGETALAESDDRMRKSLESKSPVDSRIRANVYYKRGMRSLKGKYYSQAIAEFSEAIRLKPDDLDAYFERACTYYLSKSYENSIADYTTVIRIKPDHHPAYHERGNAYRNQGRYDKALADYNKAIELSPEYARSNSGIITHRANVYENLGEYKRAISDHSKAIELDPNLSYPFFERGNIHSVIKTCVSPFETPCSARLLREAVKLGTETRVPEEGSMGARLEGRDQYPES